MNRDLQYSSSARISSAVIGLAFCQIFLVSAIGERVLDIQLKLIDLPFGEPIDQGKKRRHRGNLVPADVEHHAAHGKVRANQLSQGTAANRETACEAARGVCRA